MKIISCVDVAKDYHHNKLTTHVLKNINIAVRRGEFLAVTGPSGSGKTTLLYVMSGLEKCSAGVVSLFGKDVASLGAKELADIRKRRLGFVFQFYNLLPNLTVYENIMLAKVIAGNAEGDIDETLAIVSMEKRKNYFPTQLSGGEQQRVAVARAIINNPDIIFADEPTGNLDIASGVAVMELFKKLNVEYRKTIVLVTHSEEILKYCGRHVRLLDGEIIGDEKIGV
ncbi:MAG: ABC transporter ATP-binding protein [Bacillota bacterium]|jgi:putative ABC transport system ATP-binding protein|nr:ABC transporter ATP-binding protein [Bacillota bacterium]